MQTFSAVLPDICQIKEKVKNKSSPQSLSSNKTINVKDSLRLGQM
jgi:hypothetical protein